MPPRSGPSRAKADRRPACGQGSEAARPFTTGRAGRRIAPRGRRPPAARRSLPDGPCQLHPDEGRNEGGIRIPHPARDRIHQGHRGPAARGAGGSRQEPLGIPCHAARPFVAVRIPGLARRRGYRLDRLGRRLPVRTPLPAGSARGGGLERGGRRQGQAETGERRDGRMPEPPRQSGNHVVFASSLFVNSRDSGGHGPDVGRPASTSVSWIPGWTCAESCWSKNAIIPGTTC